jgi:hypothetical protein
MSNTIPTRPGQVNGSGSTDANMLVQWGGEIMAEFENNTVFKEGTFVRQVKGQKSASFPFVGSPTVSEHVAGTFIDGQQINFAEKIVTIDNPTVVAQFLASFDEMRLHYDVRAPISKEMGLKLAYNYDANIARCSVLAARASSPLTGRPGGSRITNTNMATDAAILETAIFGIAQTFDEKNVVAEGRKLYLKPVQFYTLAQREKLINKDLGGSGEISKGTLGTVANVKLVKSNFIPTGNESALGTLNPKYRGNWSTTVAVATVPMAVATVELEGIAMDSEYETRRRGTFMTASYSAGHDWLRPDCAIELATGAVV